MPAATQDPTLNLLSGDVVERVRRLELFSRLRVQGGRAGDNPAPGRGSSTDFLQHRPYVAGDSPRHLDWRLLAKTDRLYVRQYQEHTNAEMLVAVDLSGSMRFRGRGRFSKYEYAVRCAAVLFYLMHLQRDSFSLLLFGTAPGPLVPRGSSRTHLRRIYQALVTPEPAGPTHFTHCFRLLEGLFARRGLVLVLSDFMADPDAIGTALGRLRMRQHDVVALQLFEPTERSLPFVDFTRFRDAEDGSVLGVDPLTVKHEYERQFARHQQRLKQACLARGIDHVALPVADDYDTAIGEYLRRRAALLT